MRISIVALLIVCSSISLVADSKDDTLKVIVPDPVHAKESKLITDILTNYHYRKTPFKDSLSSVLFDNFFEVLDPGKAYFVQSDRDGFEHYRNRLDDQIPKGVLNHAYDIFDVFQERYLSRLSAIDILIAKYDFDFNREEFYDTERKNLKWANTLSELDDKWRKIIKSQLLSMKLSGKTLEESRKILKKRYDRNRSAMTKYKSEDVFQLYMNALSTSFDPHTNYFSPAASDNFKIEMSRSLEGIGARLYVDNDYTVVSEIIAGGPAFKSNSLHKDDRIIGIAQGDDGEVVDVFGWRIDEVVKLIRGTKGTVVKLTILSADDGANALPHELRLVREKIKLEDQAIKTQIVPYSIKGKSYNFGVIDIPAFYMDFDAYRQGEKDFSSTSRDVRAALEDLKAKNIDGIVVDLRRNGGGLLSEAIDLSGLFIKDGPVVQVKNTNGAIEVGKDKDSKMVYSGPLVVLTSHASASASEIFAGAIQDYERGVIIGDQTYGKGTVQNIIDLAKYLPEFEEEAGQLKLTLSKYYRVTGNTTQHLGVRPDIQLPSAYDANEIGESAEPSALPWDQITGTEFESTHMVSESMLAELRKRYENRFATDEVLKNLIADIEELKEDRNNFLVSLNEKSRLTEREEAEKRRESRKRQLTGKLSKEGEVKEDTKTDDAYLHQTLLILADLINSKKQ